MATQRESSDEEENEEKVLETEISALRSAKKELFEKARPINKELERIAQRERECVDRLHRLAIRDMTEKNISRQFSDWLNWNRKSNT